MNDQLHNHEFEQGPLVSVLMTSYNRAKYIAVAIESVLNSSLTDFELIIVDDGSKDDTVAIAKEFSQNDPRVKVFVNEKNLGDYPNRNKAASYARGKYLKYVDSDDYIYPWTLEIMSGLMEQNPDAGWGLCSMEPNTKKPFPIILSPKEAYEYHYQGPGLFRRAPLSAIIRRKEFNEVGGFHPIRMAGDFDMWQRLAQHYHVVLMPEGMVWYRVHDAQEVNDYHKYINIYEQLKVDYLKSEHCPLDKEMASMIFKKERKKIRKYILINLLKLDFKFLRVNWRNLKIYSK